MIKLIPQIFFSTAMLVLGISVLLYAEAIHSWVSKIVGQKRCFANLISTKQTIHSMRFGGIIAIFIGSFIIWMSWRAY